ncbi:unnamed protein product, partial [Polarella glacialis]
KYKAPTDEDVIRPEGIQELCNDLGVSPMDPVTLVLSWHCRAEQMGIFTREEFAGGMQRLGCDDVAKLRAKLEELRAQLLDRVVCKDVYAFTFQFALDQGQRCLPAEMCVEFWKLLLRAHFPLLDIWIGFVEEKVKNAISKDTWMMLYDLATQVKPDLSDYDENGAWPVLIDEFVEHVRLDRNRNRTMFGAPSAPAGGLFGAPAASGGGLFGAPAAPAAGGLFGAPAAAPAGGLFGAPAATGGGLFGAPAAATGGGLFGAPAAPAAGGLFGAPAAAPAGGLFGAPAAPAAGGLFGAPAAPAGGLFGAPAAAPAGGLFGAPAAPAGGLFGAPAAAPAGGLFGAPAAPAAGGLFGAPAAAGGGLFGAPAAAGGGLSGAPAGPAAGLGGADAQFLCMELSKRMGDLYPILQRAGGDRQAAAIAAHASQAAGGSTQAAGFVAYTYSFSANPQVLAQGNAPQFNPAQHIDMGKWVQAMQNNPDPQSCYPEPLVGLPALEARLQAQQRGVEECSGALEELRKGFGNLKDHLQAQSRSRLEECRQRQQRLQRQLLQVIIALERRALGSGAARRSPQAEAQLEARLARIEEVCCAPGGARARLEELWVQVQQLLQQGPPPGGPSRLPQLASSSTSASSSSGAGALSPAMLPGGNGLLSAVGSEPLLGAPAAAPAVGSDEAAEQALRLTAKQGELLEQLAEELARRKRDVAQFEGALARFAAQGVTSNGWVI